ncbi:hypothetical protein BX616_007657, partial [Lobosporangium transversale]
GFTTKVQLVVKSSSPIQVKSSQVKPESSQAKSNQVSSSQALEGIVKPKRL